jgi:hypothetical protein
MPKKDDIHKQNKALAKWGNCVEKGEGTDSEMEECDRAYGDKHNIRHYKMLKSAHQWTGDKASKKGWEDLLK